MGRKKAFVVNKYKAPLRLAEVPEAEMAEHDVRVRVDAQVREFASGDEVYVRPDKVNALAAATGRPLVPKTAMAFGIGRELSRFRKETFTPPLGSFCWDLTALSRLIDFGDARSQRIGLLRKEQSSWGFR
ncbi:hypothetical protein [Stackebrandtia nassauensis]|uniref:Uncharacterized protein n=1 Tax=Stackebrandtia nassauensis (strain DSM 44728 / CIP 108903 / NRRL B-16338 / NBRC 102104 / LLR-40K-21) TaxID=446470 RepID=D3PX30_STANL|nr:hypothetical protein [Stackebrandtia nassauensis]ADD45254.1 hypothetical protein Snas_5624 [Stackebrandtia nassauensis DSM 44728]